MTDFPDADALIDRLELEPHPEGGYFRETWRSDLELPANVLTPDHDGRRNAGTSILYLVPADDDSAPHRVASDELWLHHFGDPLELTVRRARNRSGDTVVLGPGPDHRFQSVVPANHWQSARSTGEEAGYSLMACVVVPGFDFDDFEMA